MKTRATILLLITLFVVGAQTATLSGANRQRCLEILRSGLAGDGFWPAMHAAEGLTAAGHGKEVRRALTPRLRNETDDQRRCGLARELARAGDPGRCAVLLEILGKADPHGHVHAAESLFKVGWEGEFEPLTAAFRREGDLRLRLMAAGALAKHGDVAALGLLQQTLQLESDAKLLTQAAWLLGRVGDAADRVRIRQRIPDAPNARTRAVLEHSLAALGDAAGRQALLRNLESDDGRVRTAAASFAADARLDAAVPVLIRLLDDANADTRIRAAHSLLVLTRWKTERFHQ